METGVPPIAILPLPTEEDSLDVLDAKLSSYLYVIHAGHSIYAATGRLFGESKTKTPENLAIEGMKPGERQYYQAWKTENLVGLPNMDWNSDRRHTPTSQRPLKKAIRRAEAINRIYSTDKAEPCHYTYFAENHVLWLPLVTAIARVIGAEINRSKMPVKLQAQDRDFQTVQKIVHTALRVMSLSDESRSKALVRDKVHVLHATVRSKQIQLSCLGKRKERDHDRLDVGAEVELSHNSQTNSRGPVRLCGTEVLAWSKPAT